MIRVWGLGLWFMILGVGFREHGFRVQGFVSAKETVLSIGTGITV